MSDGTEGKSRRGGDEGGEREDEGACGRVECVHLMPALAALVGCACMDAAVHVNKWVGCIS